jgi:hypothetical protein
MREIDGKILYTVGNLAKILRKTSQTINKWYKFSEMIRKNEISRTRPGQVILPKCIRINKIKYWKEEDIDKIIKFSENIKRGDMSEFNRNFSWGKERGEEISKRIRIKKEKMKEEIIKFRDLSLSEQAEIRQKQRLSHLKREAKRKAKSI